MRNLLPTALLLIIQTIGYAKDLPAEPTSFSIPRTEIVPVTDAGTNRKYDLFIKLPRSYGDREHKNERYPVIYMTDAMYTF